MFSSMIVPLDGTEFSASAVRAAVNIARPCGASVRLVSIANGDRRPEWLRHRAEDVARGIPASDVAAIGVEVVVDPDPVAVLLVMASDPANVLCFSSHNRSKVTSAVMGSIGSELIRQARHPFIVTGTRPNDGDATDVVVALDGAHDPSPVLDTARAWARMLGSPLRLVTVYEPVPADLRRPTHFTREHGPSSDPAAYLDTLAHTIEEHEDTHVATVAVADPVSASGGLADHLAEHPARLVVVGRDRYEWSHTPMSTLRHLLRQVGTPVLVATHVD